MIFYCCFLFLFLGFLFGILARTIYDDIVIFRKKRKAAETDELASLVAERLRADESRDKPHSEG